MVRPVVSILITTLVLSLFSGIQADASDSSDVVIKQTAYGEIETGQIMQGYYYRATVGIAEPIAHVWQQRAYGYLGLNALVKKRLNLNFTAEGLTAFSTPQNATWPQTTQPRQFFNIKWVYASYPFGKIESPFLTLQAGLFPYKYNPDSRNLGEYLFRSNAYPLVIYSVFDYPQADIFGLRLNLHLSDLLLKNDELKNDLIFHSELLGMPVQDWSLSDVISYTMPWVTVGVGASLCRYFSVYQGLYPSATTDGYFYPDNLPEADKSNFWIHDTLPFTDSAFFDWKSIKLMGRASFDLKKFIPSDMFGKEDLKFYVETDLIGLKNYPLFYEHRKDRMLSMIGFNIPAFKYIDVVNLEFEYCPNNSAFSDGAFYGYSTLGLANVIPLDSFTTQGDYNVKRSPWRWSLYLKKSVIGDHISFIAQVGRDHKKIDFYYFDMAYMSFIESLQTKKDWWWTFKTEFKF